MRLFPRRISGAISTRRRSRLAGPVVMILGLLMTGGVYAALAPASASSSSAADTSTIAEGKALFQVGCSSCHGKNAEGIPTTRGGNYGPSLIGVGAASVDFQVGTGRMPMARPVAQAPRKKPVYDEEEIAAMAAYVASLAPGPAVPEAAAYDTSEVKEEGVVKGGAIWRTNCTACHNFAGTGGALSRGKYAPSIIGVPNKDIYEALITGPQQMPVFSDSVLTPADKRDLLAYLNKNEDTASYGGFTLGSLGPVAEGLFAWIVGIGGLVGMAIWIAAHTSKSTRRKA